MRPSDDSSYLYEIGSWDLALKVVETAFRACGDDYPVLRAHLLNSEASIRSNMNQISPALDLFAQSLSIKTMCLPAEHEELASTYNAMANCLMSAGRYHEAITQLEKAMAIDGLRPVQEREQILHLRHLNLGNAYVELHEYEKALEHIEIARELIINNFGEETYYEGE